MDIGRGDESMYPRAGSALESFCGAPYVLVRRAAKRRHRYFATLRGHGLNGGKVAFRGDREPGLNDIDTERFQFPVVAEGNLS